MMEFPVYDPAAIEAKWQAHWEDTPAFCAEAAMKSPSFIR
jgi:leucyl-tRNA synthetase